MWKWGTEIIGFVAAAGILAGLGWVYLSTPVVEISYRTGECVRVWDLAREYDCRHMPRRYYRVWVK